MYPVTYCVGRWHFEDELHLRKKCCSHGRTGRTTYCRQHLVIAWCHRTKYIVLLHYVMLLDPVGSHRPKTKSVRIIYSRWTGCSQNPPHTGHLCACWLPCRGLLSAISVHVAYLVCACSLSLMGHMWARQLPHVDQRCKTISGPRLYLTWSPFQLIHVDLMWPICGMFVGLLDPCVHVVLLGTGLWWTTNYASV